jgi:hypothetical protein
MNAWPPVVCLCPTYGRFQKLRLSLACFLAQDYPGEKQLFILNDAPVPFTPGPVAGGVRISVWVWNVPPGTFANLGEKRRHLLQYTSAPVACHWDDDDLYLPWHLSRSVAALRSSGAGCVKSAGAWYMTGSIPHLSVHGIHHNVFEGTMVFHADEADRLGGYPPLHSGQAKALLDAFAKAGRLFKIPDDYDPLAGSEDRGAGVCAARSLPSYVYRWDDGCGHISGIGNRADAAAQFRARNQDFGGGELTPADLAPYWDALAASDPRLSAALCATRVAQAPQASCPSRRPPQP